MVSAVLVLALNAGISSNIGISLKCIGTSLVYIAVIATILAVTLRCVDSAGALKCNVCKLESLLTR